MLTPLSFSSALYLLLLFCLQERKGFSNTAGFFLCTTAPSNVLSFFSFYFLMEEEKPLQVILAI